MSKRIKRSKYGKPMLYKKAKIKRRCADTAQVKCYEKS